MRLPYVGGERRAALRDFDARRRDTRLAARGGARARLRQNIYIRPAQGQKRARGARNDRLPHRRGIFAFSGVKAAIRSRSFVRTTPTTFSGLTLTLILPARSFTR